MWGWIRRRRRRRLMRRPLPDVLQRLLARNVPLARCLPPAERRALAGLTNVFLAEKHFEGCGGLALTDEVRVTVAAQACLLQLGRAPDFFPGLVSVLVYPHTFVAQVAERRPDGTVWEGGQARLGQSSTRGSVVLAWDAVRRRNGRNVVLHEFAHQLDGQTGSVNGTPPLPRDAAADWARVLGGRYDALAASVAAGRPAFLDAYGATSPAEFFAVATEAYFQRPRALRAHEPELFAQLRRFYGLDPCRLDPDCLALAGIGA